MAAANRNAKLTLSLVDKVTAPARAVAQSLGGLNRAMSGLRTVAMVPARVTRAAARHLRTATNDMAIAGIALGAGVKSASEQIYEMEKVLNQIEGLQFGKDNTFKLATGQIMTREQFRKQVSDFILMVDKETPRNAAEIGRAYKQLVQAGLTHEQVQAVLPISVKFSVAGDYGTEDGAEKLINIVKAMDMPMATFDEAARSSQRVADVIAYAAARSTTDVQGMTEAFKYAAPAAAALGLNVEQLAGLFMIQANAGIKGSEAGVAIRAMLVRMVRPTKMAAAALQQYGIDLADYIDQTKKVGASDILTVLNAGGVDAFAATKQIAKTLDEKMSTAAKIKKLTDIVASTVGDKSTLSRDTISNMISETLYSFGEKLDVERLITDMENANIAVSDFFRIFDVRQGARTMTLFMDDVSATIQKIRDESQGFTEALSDTMLKGIVGAVQGDEAAWLRFLRTLADTGVLQKATDAFNLLTDKLNALAKLNPGLLRFGTYAAIALAAAVPLGFALSALVSVASLLVNPIALIGSGLAYLTYLNYDKIIAFGTEFGKSFKENMGPETKKLIDDITSSISDLWEKLKSVLGGWDAGASGKSFGASMARGVEQAIAKTKEWYNFTVGAMRKIANTRLGKAWTDLGKEIFNLQLYLNTVMFKPETWKNIANAIGDFRNAFTSALSPEVVDAFKSGGSAIYDSMVFLYENLAEGVKALHQVISGLDTGFSRSAARAGWWAGEVVNSIKSAYDQTVATLSAWYTAVSENSFVKVVYDDIKSYINFLESAFSLVGRTMASWLQSYKAFWDALTSAISPETMDALSRAGKAISDMFGFASTGVGDALSKIGSKIEDFYRLLGGGMDKAAAFLDGIDINFSKVASRVGWWTGEMINAIVKLIPELPAKISEAASGLYAAGSQMIQSLWDGAVAKFNEFVEWVKSIPSEIVAAIGRIDLSGLISWGGGGGTVAVVPSTASQPPAGTPAGDPWANAGFSNSYGGARASGGPVKAGLTYLVGEQGPEPFVPSTNGTILPHGALQGGGSASPVTIAPTVNMHVHGAGGDLKAIARQAAEAVVKELNSALDTVLARSERVALAGVKPYGDY